MTSKGDSDANSNPDSNSHAHADSKSDRDSEPTPGGLRSVRTATRCGGGRLWTSLGMGLPSNNIDIYRNSMLIATVPNILGFDTDHIGGGGKGTYTYKVCEAGTQNWSNQVTARFGGGG